MNLELGVGLPPSRDIVRYALAAESLGYKRMWVYDSPALYGDVWVAVARVAEATELGVGTAVAVPCHRHPMVTASAIATIEDLAPGRLITTFGTGFSARRAMGGNPMRWRDLADYMRTVRALLAGKVVDIDGNACQMIHPSGWAPERPIDTRIWSAPMGPLGMRTSKELESEDVVDGVMLTQVSDAQGTGFRNMGVMANGTVLQPGEDETTPRVIEAVGPWFGTGFHSTWEFSPEALDVVPGGREWREGMLAARPERERHLAVHEGHVTMMTDRDRRGVIAAGPAMLQSGWTGTPESIRTRMREAIGAGVTHLVYNPAGPDIRGELERFANALRER